MSRVSDCSAGWFRARFVPDDEDDDDDDDNDNDDDEEEEEANDDEDVDENGKEWTVWQEPGWFLKIRGDWERGECGARWGAFTLLVHFLLCTGRDVCCSDQGSIDSQFTCTYPVGEGGFASAGM